MWIEEKMMFNAFLTKKPLYEPVKAIISILFLLLATGFFLFGLTTHVSAQAPFQDSFEDYDVGNLCGQDEWADESCNFQVNTEKASQGTKSIKCERTGASCGDAIKTGEPVSFGVWDIDFYTDSNTTAPCDYMVVHFNEGSSTGFTWQSWNIGGVCKMACGKSWGSLQPYFDISYDAWHTAKMEWNSYDDKARCKLDNNSWSEWFDTYAFEEIDRIYIFSSPYGYGKSQRRFFDNIAEETSEMTGYHPDISLETPTICQYNQVDLEAVEVKGQMKVPLDNPYAWDTLRFGFMNVGDHSLTKYQTATSTPITAGMTWNFDYFIDVSSACPPPNYPPCVLNFGMWAFGKDSQGKYYSEFYPYGCDTEVGDPAQAFYVPPPAEEFPSYPEEEECSGYDLLERLVCEVKNALKGIFLPSSAKIQELQATIGQIKQKFPYNYIAFLKEFYDDIKQGVNITSTIEFKILGQAGAVDLSFWEKTADVGGITQTFSHIIKNIAYFVILLVFLMWGISFGRRIFR